MKRKATIASPVREKISWAEGCLRMHGEALKSDEAVPALLGQLKKAIADSRRKMIEAGIADLCRECEEKEGGSCCGAGLEDKYDPNLLLINLLLGVKLPKRRHDRKSCFFLGEEGCILQARHVICVNYVCGKITGRTDPSRLKALREREGTELDTVFLLHERVGRILRAN